MNYKRSSALFAQAETVIPGGVNSPVRAFKAVGGTPIFVKEAKGAYLYDEDGRKLIDYIASWGPMILGHAHKPVVDAVVQKAQKGTSLTTTAVLRAKLMDNRLTESEVIFEALPYAKTRHHYGSRLEFDQQGYLFISVGDRGSRDKNPQNLDNHCGKIHRIHDDGRIPDDNPFVDQRGAMPSIYSYGHRNVQGLHYDAATGSLWAHEHGPRGGDELNLILPGKNYGWPLATTGTDYSGSKITPFKTHAGSEAFIKDWVPSIAPSGLTIYRGDMFDAWNGDALVGGLASHDLRRVDLENGRAVGEESLLTDLDGRIRDVRLDLDGAILVVIDDPEAGRVLRITPK